MATVVIPKVAEKEKVVEEVLVQISNIEDKDVRRILRQATRFCERIGGTPSLLVSGKEYPIYSFTCVTEDPLPFFLTKMIGRGVDISVLTGKAMTYIRVPDEWFSSVWGGIEYKAYGFNLEIEKTLGAEGYSIRINAIKKE